MNFNLTGSPEVSLFKSVSRELIDIYGIQLKLILTSKLNVSSIGNDWTSIKPDSTKIFELYALPDTSDDFESLNYHFDQMGFNSGKAMTCYVSAPVLDSIVGLNQVIGNLVVLPSGYVMEITDVDIYVPQVNNLYSENDDKSVYKLRLVQYEFKLHDQITDSDMIGKPKIDDPDADVIGELKTSLYKHKVQKKIMSKTEQELEEITKDNYKVLDDYINTLDERKKEQDFEVLDPNDVIYDNTELDVWHKR